MQINGSQIMIECLLEQGVDTIFGYPGGSILNVYDELYRYQDRIRHVLTSHEQGASHAADGYARATGKVGVCMATSGPGATNLVTGIATAYMDSVPMVAITCNVTLPMLGKDSFQEVDIAGVTMPITKHSFIVKDVKDLAAVMRRAFKIAQTGRPGPVLVDVTKDVTAAVTDFTPQTPELIQRQVDTIDEKDIESVVNAIKKSQRPMIFVGGGAVISGAEKELKEFVYKVDAPVTDTLMGKGAFDGTDPYYTGMLGMHGTKTANLSVTECDLLIVLGARFSDRVTGNAKKFANRAEIVHIDIDPAEINKNIPVDYSIIGDLKAVLEILNRKLEQHYHKAWVDKVMARKEALPLSYHTDALTGPYVIERISELTDNEAIITTDVGQHQMWAAQYCDFRAPRKMVSSGGLGTMGFGLGAAIGASVGSGCKTVLITGDGSFGMNLNELATAVSIGAPVTVVIFNNGVLGMVRQWQTLFFNKHYSSTTLNRKTDFVKLAEAFGAQGFYADTPETFTEVFRKAYATGEPCVIDCRIDPNEFVLPMLPPGGSIDDIITEKEA